MPHTQPIHNMISIKKTNKCDHDYNKKDGIISCSKCSSRAIMYLLPLKK